MEKHIQRLLVITGLLVGAGFAALPLASYAAPVEQFKAITKDDRTLEGNSQVNVIVGASLALDLAAGSVSIPLDYNAVKTGTIGATVTANQEYTVSLSAAEPRLVHAENSSYSIPASDNVAVGTDAWGVKKSGATTYTGLTTTPVVFYTGTSADSHSFEVGISLGSFLPAGTYSTDVTVTAALKN